MSDLRMPDLNKVLIAGRLTRDPELRYLPSGAAVCSMGIAVSRRYRTKDGEQKEETTFLDVETWNKSAEFCGENLKKGRPVLVDGSLKSESWEDKNTGSKRSKIKINAMRVNLLDWDSNKTNVTKPAPAANDAPLQGAIPEDELPF